MKLPDKIFIPKEQVLAGLIEDVRKSIKDPNVTVECLEWRDDGLIAHLTYGDKIGSKI